MRRADVVCAFVLTVGTVVSSWTAESHGQQDAKTLTSLRDSVLKARTPDEAAIAHQALFDRVGRDGIQDLQCDEETGIALQAAWREVQERIKEGAKAIPASDIQRFLGFIEGRIRCKLPRWWEKTLAAGVVSERQIGYVSSKEFKYKDRTLGVLVPEDVSLNRDGELVTIKQRKRQVTAPLKALTKPRHGN